MKCRLCGSEEGQSIRAEYVFGGRKEHKFWECKNCSVNYLYPYLTDEEEKRFYRQEFEKFMSKRVGDHRDWSNADKHKKSNRDQVVRRWKYLKEDFKNAKIKNIEASVLEIGCSSGFMLEHFRKFGMKCFGVEPSGEFLEFLIKNKFIAYESLEELRKNEKIKYDLIVHFFVFEHIANPFDFLHDTYDMLAKGGVMIMEVPSATDVLTSMYNIPAFERFYWSIAHHYYYTPQSIEYIMSKLGYKYEILPEQRYDISNHITWLMDGKCGGQGRFDVFSKKTNISYMNDLKNSWKCDTMIVKIYKD